MIYHLHMYVVKIIRMKLFCYTKNIVPYTCWCLHHLYNITHRQEVQNFQNLNI